MTTTVPAGLLACAVLAMAQAVAPPPAFEVASVKLMEPAIGSVVSRMGGDPGRFECANEPLNTLLAYAYNLRVTQISGPSWIRTERYSIVAKIPDAVPRDQVRAMLQGLLIERLQMKVHQETKEEPVYVLLVGKDGPKLEKVEVSLADGSLPGGSIKVIRDRANGGAGLKLNEVTMATLANGLSSFLDRPVVDMTELKGAYSFTLAIPTYELPGMAALRPRTDIAAGEPSAPDANEPSSIFQSIRQFGLRLEGRRGPVGYLVVDHAERVPTEN